MAQITKVLDRHIQVRFFYTPTPPLENLPSQGLASVTEHLGQAHFRRTWYTHGGVNHGKAIMTPSFSNNHALRVWEGLLDV